VPRVCIAGRSGDWSRGAAERMSRRRGA
jgi:hypothetical protein